MIESQMHRGSINARFAQNRATRRRKVLGALITNVVLRGPQASPVSSSFKTMTVNGDQLLADAGGASLGEQSLNEPFRLVVVAFPEVVMSQTTLRVDKVESWPILVLECAPYRKIVVDRDRIRQSHALHGTANVIDVPFEWELRCVHADHDQSKIFVLFRPGANIGDRAQPIDTGVGPHINEDDFPAQAGCRQRWGVEPLCCTAKRRQLDFN